MGTFETTREREVARSAILSPQYSRVVLDLARWLALPEAEPAPAPGEDLVSLASRILRRRHKRLLADASRMASLRVEERHRVRIDAKRLRYSVDALASLFGAKRVRRYMDVLAALQDALGNANDGLGYILQSFEAFDEARQGIGFGGTNLTEYEDAYAIDGCFGDMVLETTLGLVAGLL